MLAELTGLQINLYLVDGSVARFIQEEPGEIAKILASIHPARLFAQPTLVIGGRYSTSAYPAAAVTHIAFATHEQPDWAVPHEEADLTEISREEFLKHAGHYAEEPRQREPAPQVGEVAVSHGRIGLIGGGRIYVEVRTRIQPRLDQRHLFQRIFSAPCFILHRADHAGIVLINTANIVSVGLFPGLPDMPATAWPAHHMPG